MQFIIIGIVLFLVFFGLPKPAKILVFIVNCFLPDPVPYVDEIIMVAGVLMS